MIKITTLFLCTFFFLGAKRPASLSDLEIPALSNKSSPFRGKIIHKDYEGYTWVTYPHVENSASLDVDPRGRLFVVESNRFKHGVEDLRAARYMVARDFQSQTLEDRLQLYKEFSNKIPMDWYTSVPDRIIQLEDRDGNGVADFRSVFANDINETLDGISFSVLAERDAIYLTSIPSLRKLTDSDNDGVADFHEKIVNGFGVRISFTGHDLHGIIRGPDGRLYFTVGDRGFHVVDSEGQTHAASGRGAVFRCESDGSSFEVVAHGLRNPQEIAFDQSGNLFTFDNTGDIGDKARIVYVLENSDSGWDMSHQSAHQYVKDLDWGGFHIKKSVWVGEKMFETFTEDQPQWVYPPVGFLGHGPSGIAWVTGDALPDDLKESFLVTNYRGSPSRCEVIVARMKRSGAGFALRDEKVLVNNVGIADVAYGYDGNIYFADFGGGWSVNTNGSIQVIRPSNKKLQEQGKAVAQLVADGFDHRSLPELEGLLEHSDQRVRQAAQFAMVNKGVDAILPFKSILVHKKYSIYAKLHSIWGLGQLARKGHSEMVSPIIEDLFQNKEDEIRANAAKVAGDSGLVQLVDALVNLLNDSSPRVVSLAAIALGRVGDESNPKLVSALLKSVEKNKGSNFDPVLRHSYVSALSRIASLEQIIVLAKSESVEQRLVAVILLRRAANSALMTFLDDKSSKVREEAIRAIYDTAALDGLAGQKLALVDPSGYSYYIQSRIVASNFRLGTDESAKRLLRLCDRSEIDNEVKKLILNGLLRWGMELDTDPILGHYRPMPAISSSMTSLRNILGDDLKKFLMGGYEPDLISLATNLAQKMGLSMDVQILRKQIKDHNLDAQVRVANLNSMSDLQRPEDNELLLSLLNDESEGIRAASFQHSIKRGLPGIESVSLKAIQEDSSLVARKIMLALVTVSPESMIALWKKRELELRPELWLDLYLLLSKNDHAESQKVAATYAAGEPGRVHALSLYGGDREKGERVFRNQGACMQCHQIDKEGGVQGPPLSLVGDRLKPTKLLESIVNPSAEITPGYGLSSVSTKDGLTLVGRVVKQAKEKGSVVVISPDEKETELTEEQILSISPPVSAMPPLGLTLSPIDLRDLIAFLKSRNKKDLLAIKKEKKSKSLHGDK